MCNTTIVIFRKDRTGHKECFALFPEMPADIDGMYCTAYQRVGQHCSADYHGCIANSDPASAAEFTDLFDELERRGYNLVVRKRASPAMHDKRRWLVALQREKRRQQPAEPLEAQI